MVIIQRKHKKASKTVSNFFFDTAVEGMLALVSSFPVIYGYLRVVEVGGEYFYIFLQIIIILLTVIYAKIFPFMTLYFNNFKAIKNDDLRLKIKNLQTKTRFPSS